MSGEIFKEVLDNDEEIIWIGKPTLLPFLARGVGFLIIGLIWGSFDFNFISMMFKTGANAPTNMLSMALPFMILHTAPCWLSIGNMIRLYLIFPNTVYCYTNKRIIIRGGFRGIDYKSIDFDKIQNIEVNVNPLENKLNVGTIKIFSGETGNKGAGITNDLIGIITPYEVFKHLKKISIDVKTDFNYPNELRPENNPGYKTKYTVKNEK